MRPLCPAMAVRPSTSCCVATSSSHARAQESSLAARASCSYAPTQRELRGRTALPWSRAPSGVETVHRQPWIGLSRAKMRGSGTEPCRGILDHYRREKGIPVEDKPRNVDPETWAAIKAAESGEATSSFEDDGVEECPVECVREIFTVRELDHFLSHAEPDALVVVDFYKTACGSCRYIAPGFVKLCKASLTGEKRTVFFLKHNVMDPAEQLTDLAEKLAIKAVPKFHFYKAGKLLDQFPTRDRETIAKAINKHAGYEVLHLSEAHA